MSVEYECNSNNGFLHGLFGFQPTLRKYQYLLAQGAQLWLGEPPLTFTPLTTDI